jgi:hypothetical protein
VVVAFVMACGVARGQPRKAAAARPAASPAEALRQFIDATKAGDKDRLIASLPEKEGKAFQAWLGAAQAAAKSTLAFHAVLAKKFGPDPSDKGRKGFDLKKELAEDITAFEVVGGRITPDKNQRAEFKVRISAVRPDKQKTSRERAFIAVKRAAGWAAYPVDLAGANYAAGIEFLTRLRKTMDRAAKDVAGGKYKSRAEAYRAVEREVFPTIPEAMPVPRYMSRTRAARP